MVASGLVQNDKFVRISAGEALSNEIDLENGYLCGVFVPEPFVGTSLKVLAATSLNSNFVPVDDGTGEDLELPVSSSDRFVPVPSVAKSAGVRFLKLQSDQNQDEDIGLSLARLVRSQTINPIT